MSYNSIEAKLTKTGRSTRLVKAAVKSAVSQQAVYIVVAHFSDVSRMERLVDEIIESTVKADRASKAARLGIKVEPFIAVRDQLDWTTMTFRGAHRKCAVFVDHFTISAHFSDMLRELHRFDEGG